MPSSYVEGQQFEILSNQIKQLQKQQQTAESDTMAAYDHSRNWQAHPNRQLEQLQRQVTRLAQDL